ncbi:MAG: hypothetical protein FJ087_01560 [Deltaproteobacteria bacterium]|nr:hypothetical protein [Deltaproteobacteria bacterium]
MELSQERIDELKRRYGVVKELTIELAPEGEDGAGEKTPARTLRVIVHKPSRPQYRRHQDTLASDGLAKAFEMLCTDCIEAPPLAELQPVFNEFPGVPARIAHKLLEMVGTGAEVKERTF